MLVLVTLSVPGNGELDTHDVILAEGLPTQSFVDNDNREMFHNAAEWERTRRREEGRPLSPRLSTCPDRGAHAP